MRLTRDVNSESERHLKVECGNTTFNEQELRERRILINLFEQTNGMRWYSRENWTHPVNHCCWYGITCNNTNGSLFVTTIKLASNNLSGSLPSSVLNLRKLQILQFTRNYLMGELENILIPNATHVYQLGFAFNLFGGQVPWQTLATYPSLKKLQLSDNHAIRGKTEESLGKLKHLEVLTLGHTKVGGRVPEAIKYLQNLWFIDLEALNLEGNIDFIKDLPNLRYVHLRGNKLRGELPPEIGTKLINLEELYVSNNLISGELHDTFHNTLKLTVINVASNRLHGQVPTTVAHLPNLLYLDISSNQFHSLSSNLSFPSLQFLILANNPFQMDPNELINTLLKMQNRTGLRTLDISSCGLTGNLPKRIWMFTNIMVLKVSNNSFYGKIPSPIVVMYYLIEGDFSNNNLSGPMPMDFSLLDAVRTLDLRNNTNMISINESGGMPWFTVQDPNTRVRELPHQSFTCPTFRLNNTNNGLLLINSSYYHHIYCTCDPGFYGYKGVCLSCPAEGKCKGEKTNSVIEMPVNYYPSPSQQNMTAFVRCSLFYQNTFRCNPNGNCTCQLRLFSSDVRVLTTCDSHCTCAYNSTSRLCSQCIPNFYKESDICLPCSDNDSTTIVATTAAVLIILLTIWLLSRIKPKCIAPTVLKAFNIGAIIFQIGLVMSLGIAKIIPAYVAELHIFIVVFAIFDYLASIKVFAVIVLVYFQVLNSLNVSSQSVDCQHCSFAEFLNKGVIAKVLQTANFHFNGISCTFQFLASPFGKLAALAVAPLALGIIITVGRLIDHYLLVRLCAKRNEVEIEELRQTMTNNSKSNIIFLLNVFYYPIAQGAIKALLPCDRGPGDTRDYMRAYPWINCSSSKYTELVILGGLVTALYVCLIPIVFLVLLRKYAPKKLETEESIVILSTTSSVVEEEVVEWLHGLCSNYKTKYCTWLPVILMLRRLFIAIVLASFKQDQVDAQAFVLTILFTASIIFITVLRPYKNTTPWQLENTADVGAFVVIFVTYSSMSSRQKVSPVTATFAFFLNMMFIIAMVVTAIGQAVYVFREKHKESRPLQKKTSEYTKLPGENKHNGTPDYDKEYTFNAS